MHPRQSANNNYCLSCHPSVAKTQSNDGFYFQNYTVFAFHAVILYFKVIRVRLVAKAIRILLHSLRYIFKDFDLRTKI